MVVYCTYCGQSFTRDEHLDRHIRTHTEVKPFRCFKCHLGFSRSDLLQRHIKFHDRDFVSESYPSMLYRKSRAQRTPIACQNCAASKTKCDRSYPCKRCVSKNLNCIVRESQRTRRNLSILGSTSDIEKGGGGAPKEQGKPRTSKTNDYGRDIPDAFKGPVDPDEDIVFQKTPIPDDSSSTTNIGISNLSSDTREGNMELEKFVDTEWLPGSYQYSGESLMDPISTRFSVLDSDQLILPMGKPPNDDNIDPSFQSNLIPVIEVPTWSETQAEDFILFEKQDGAHEVSRLQLYSAMKDYTDIAVANTGKDVKVAEALARLDSDATFMPNLESANWREETENQGLITDAPEIDHETLLSIIRAIFDKLSQLDNQSSLELSYALVGCSKPIPDSHSVPAQNTLDKLFRIFTTGFDKMFPLLEQKLSGRNLLSKETNFLDCLFLIVMIAQAISSAPCSERTSTASRNALDACRVLITRRMETETFSSEAETALYVYLLYAYQLFWNTPGAAVEDALGFYRTHAAKIKTSYLRNRWEMEKERQINSASHRNLPWETWKQWEKQRRLLYSWVIIDLEASLFYSQRPGFETAELVMPLPDAESLWHASSASQWQDAVHNHYSQPSYRPASLHEVFQSFVDNVFPSDRSSTNIWQLRVLLYPLHGMIHHCNQLNKEFTGSASFLHGLSRRRILSHIHTLLDEARLLLERWYEMAETFLLRNPECPVIGSALILYHVLFLETLVHYPFVDRICQQHITSKKGQLTPISSVPIAVSTSNHGLKHCLSILNITKGIAMINRPTWWPFAVSRAGLTLWTIDHCLKASLWNCDKCYLHDDLDNIRPNVRAPERRSSACKVSMSAVVNDVLKQCVKVLSEDKISPEVQAKRDQLIDLLVN